MDPQPGTLRKVAYDHIRHKLATGELPPGARLSNRALATEIGMSFIPVREAISQLASEGFVEHRPGDGSFVAAPHANEIRELYDLREALECHALEAAIDHLDEAGFRSLEAKTAVLADISTELARHELEWDGETIRRCVEADTRFHLAILEAAGNSRVLHIIGDLRLLTRLFTSNFHTAQPLSDLPRTCREHHDLIEAMRQHDVAKARALLAKHIRTSADVAIALFEREHDGAETATP